MELFSLLWEHISMKDLADIVTVSLLLYQFLLIAQGTKAIQMAIGVMVFGVLYWLSALYGLDSLYWLLTRFFDSIFIVLVIIFQDQIRTTLASFGMRRGRFGGVEREKLEEEIDEVVEAVRALSQEQVGGLIVFERANGLANYIETGTLFNGKIHSDLIYAIFQSNSPIHDGAIIISGGHLAGAGCFLPLSKNIEIERRLGTRHRAALGLTEITDAVVVTVSEETGDIKVSVGGEFFPCENAGRLRQYLKYLATHTSLDNGNLENEGVVLP